MDPRAGSVQSPPCLLAAGIYAATTYSQTISLSCKSHHLGWEPPNSQFYYSNSGCRVDASDINSLVTIPHIERAHLKNAFMFQYLIVSLFHLCNCVALGDMTWCLYQRRWWHRTMCHEQARLKHCHLPSCAMLDQSQLCHLFYRSSAASAIQGVSVIPIEYLATGPFHKGELLNHLDQTVRKSVFQENSLSGWESMAFFETETFHFPWSIPQPSITGRSKKDKDYMCV